MGIFLMLFFCNISSIRARFSSSGRLPSRVNTEQGISARLASTMAGTRWLTSARKRSCFSYISPPGSALTPNRRTSRCRMRAKRVSSDTCK